MQNLRKIIINSGLVFGSLIFTYLALELVVFRFFIQWLPLRTYALLDPAIRIFAQSSKKETIPKDYIVLLGDSYAIGLGDWFLKVNKNINPDFHSAHLIYNRTGIDVINFGHSGADSMRTLVSYPRPNFNYHKKSLLYNLEEPKYIIVYFHEGSDIYDNIREIRTRYKPNYDINKVYDPVYFRKFLEKEVVPNHELYYDTKHFVFWDNLFVAKYIKALVLNFKDVMRIERTFWPLGGHGPWFNDPTYKPEKWHERWSQALPLGKYHQGFMGQKVVGLPDHLLPPPLEVTEEEVKLGAYVFEQSMLYLREHFPDSKIGIVYIPSSMTCYRMLSSKVFIQPYFRPAKKYFYPIDVVIHRSRLTFDLIETISKKYNISFLDLRPYVWNVTEHEYIHGPVDWLHFNKKGYTILAEAVVHLIEQLDRSELK